MSNLLVPYILVLRNLVLIMLQKFLLSTTQPSYHQMKLMRKNMLFFYSCSLGNLMWLTCLVKKDLFFNCTNSWLDTDHMNENVFIFQLMISFFMRWPCGWWFIFFFVFLVRAWSTSLKETWERKFYICKWCH